MKPVAPDRKCRMTSPRTDPAAHHQPLRPPRGLTFLGVCHVLLGCLGLMCHLCGGFVLLLLGHPREPLWNDMRTFLMREVPFWVPATIGSVVLGMFVSVGLVVAGIGLLNHSQRARKFAVFLAALMLVGATLAILHHFLFTSLALRRFLDDNRWFGRPGELRALAWSQNISLGFGLFIHLIYAMMTLGVLFRKDVRRFLQEAAAAEAFERDQSERPALQVPPQIPDGTEEVDDASPGGS